MKKYIIISTYPENGSKNIGDYLITKTLSEFIKVQKGDCNISIVYRAANWSDVKDDILSADFILFACLAIRVTMHVKEYPFLEKVINSNIPYGVISAGTSLNVSKNSNSFSSEISSESLSLLHLMNSNALFFSTRGILTQYFCNSIGISNAIYTGDIAFYNKNFTSNTFKKRTLIKQIAISDPHYYAIYKTEVELLINGVKEIFPDATISIVQHGENTELNMLAKRNDVSVIPIFQYKNLDFYNEIDLHVGFRVHGHVSSLSRGIPSYLLEQDGRGCDYGLTLSKKISVPNYIEYCQISTRKKFIYNLLKKKRLVKKCVNEKAVEEILAMIENDKQSHFVRFLGLEKEIHKISNDLELLIKKMP